MDGEPKTLMLPNGEESRYKDESYGFIQDDEQSGAATIILMGVNEFGNSVFCMVQNYRPWIRVEVPDVWTDADLEKLRLSLLYSVKNSNTLFGNNNVEAKYEFLKRFYGFVPDSKDNNEAKKFKYARFNFSTFKSAQQATYYLNKQGLYVTEKSLKSTSRFLNDLNLCTSDWITMQNYTLFETTFQRKSNCQIELCCDITQLKYMKNDSIAPLLIASFDGEMYSNDGTFPNVNNGDNTIYIGISFWVYGTDISNIERHVLCADILMVPPNQDIIVHIFQDSKTLIEGFRDLLVKMDPDIITGWNIYGFDFPFLHKDYMSSLIEKEFRGTESLQISLLNIARSIIDLEPVQAKTASQYLAQYREKRGHYETRNWIQEAEKKYGSKSIRLLLKQEPQNNMQLNLFEDVDDDDEESDLDAGIAFQIRSDFKNLLIIPSGKNLNFVSYLKDFTMEQQDKFYATVELKYSKAIRQLIEKPRITCAQRALYLSRFACEKSSLSEKRMTSAAKGDNTYSFWNMTGRVIIDLMQIIKDDKKPEDNTLKFAATHWLEKGSEKIDLSAAEMFEAYRKGSMYRWPIAEYCARDCDIPLRLIARLSYVPTWIEMSRVCYTSCNEIVNSGQQVKVFNLISRFVWNEYALNVRDSGWPISKQDNMDENKKRLPDYQGATVIEPKAGFYKDCISTLDFESLYPSIIRYFNLCPSVLVLDNFPGLVKESHIITHNVLLDNKEYQQIENTYSFAVNTKGVLPNLLKRLLDARKAVKKLMAASKDPLEKAILNGRQNGIKVACNSVYGFCGVSADRGLLPCKPVAAVTTLKGRAFIDAAKNYVESTYKGSDVIYGDTDSVMIKWGEGISVEEASTKGEEAALAITQLLRNGQVENLGGAGSALKKNLEACSAVTLAYEKTYKPYLLMKKKNYAGLKYSGDIKSGFKTEIDIKGIDAIRRDRPKLLRDASNKILDCLLREISVDCAMKSLRDSLNNISTMDNLEDFVLSKSLKSNYASNNLPHVTAWLRMTQRGDSDIPPIGARMPFVVVVDKGGFGGKKSKTKLYDRTEHPAYVKSANLKVDRQYYVETLQNPLSKLLQFVVDETIVKNIFKEYTEKASLKASQIQSLLGFRVRDDNLEDEFIVQKKSKLAEKSVGKIESKIESSLKKFMV